MSDTYEPSEDTGSETDSGPSYEYDEGDWGGWDTDPGAEQGNLPGQE
jgi:hypothetical protein